MNEIKENGVSGTIHTRCGDVVFGYRYKGFVYKAEVGRELTCLNAAGKPCNIKEFVPDDGKEYREFHGLDKK